MIPSSGKRRLESTVLERSDWCISRQRVWGVPIPVFYNIETDEPLLSNETNEYLKKLIVQHGTDCWFNFSVEELLPESLKSNAHLYRKSLDTMDVWFDSGTSWCGVLHQRNLPLPSDMYIEGSDQHRGWFQSSLLTSVAVTGSAPYKQVMTHGFVLDENGQKMSKSLGNVIDPAMIIEGTKSNVPLGADVLRVWVASVDFKYDVSIGPTSLSRATDLLRKVRNTIKFILGNLYDFKLNDILPYSELSELDKFILHKLYLWSQNITHNYEVFDFHQVILSIADFISVDISAIYFDACKDRLYVEAPTSKIRRSCQTVLYILLNEIITAISPIACFLAQDAIQHLPNQLKQDPKNFIKWFSQNKEWHRPELEIRWETIFNIRDEFNKLLNTAREQKKIAANLEANLLIKYSETSNLMKAIKSFEEEFTNILVISKVTCQLFSNDDKIEKLGVHEMELKDGSKITLYLQNATGCKCPRCWKRISLQPDLLCTRCDNVVNK
eukprot:TRINITY_DN1275_c0_g1_i2.p1 TRINITY_DN1275_c0_g1~~TRINITY_DN1275_c0_g1_i2.p1  ORF type:complete len:497 (-),score=198.84 TRINITY_DN1275_c0_g1_i2:101-1591(-)